jgi:hypothetical protein
MSRDTNRPTGGIDDPAQRTQGRGLPGAVRSDEAEYLAPSHVEREAGHGRHGAICLGEVVHLDDGCCAVGFTHRQILTRGQVDLR